VRKLIDRALAVLLGLGAGIGHTLGSLKAYAHEPMTLLWALNTSVFGVTLAAFHLFRTYRPNDRALAWILVLPTLAFMVSCVWFGLLIHAPADPRVVAFLIIGLGLTGFSLAKALSPSKP
jgi:hypothetical protein